jgi:hypothetical protein
VVAAGSILEPTLDPARVAIIRLGAVTHGNDMDQRLVGSA